MCAPDIPNGVCSQRDSESHQSWRPVCVFAPGGLCVCAAPLLSAITHVLCPGQIVRFQPKERVLSWIWAYYSFRVPINRQLNNESIRRALDFEKDVECLRADGAASKLINPWPIYHSCAPINFTTFDEEYFCSKLILFKWNIEEL